MSQTNDLLLHPKQKGHQRIHITVQ